MSQTLFERIIAREEPGRMVHEDATVVAFHDLRPQAPVHILIVPRKPIPRISRAEPGDREVLGQMLWVAAEVARKVGLDPGGYRLVINNGCDGGETIPHLHCHLLGGRRFRWPPG